MSTNFGSTVNEETRDLLRGLFGKEVAGDGKSFLYDNLYSIRQQDMKALANAAHQPAVFEMHSTDQIKTMSDGTRYRVTPTGWKKIE